MLVGDLLYLMSDKGVLNCKEARITSYNVCYTKLLRLTYDPATGLLYAAIEEAESILEIDPETFAMLREFPLPRDFRGQTDLVPAVPAAAPQQEGQQGAQPAPPAPGKEARITSYNVCYTKLLRLARISLNMDRSDSSIHR